jgi:hypothetical protein
MNVTNGPAVELPPEIVAKLDEAIYEFHVRAFGEEMARVNHLPLEQRRTYVFGMIDYALSKGVRFEKSDWGVTP